MTTTNKPANTIVRGLAPMALLALALAAGCPSGNAAECEVASDCADNQVCNGSNECVDVSEPDPTPGPGVDPCAFVTCSGNGTCAVASGAAVCICDDGFSPSGTDCIEDVDSCDNVDCSGNGTCALANGAAVCICDDGFEASGLTCIASLDPCNGVNCSGQGNCVDNGGTASCICNNGFAPGADLSCIPDNDPCSGVTCSGQGVCKKTEDTVSCECNDGFSALGLTCVSDGDPCDGVTCSNQGTCAEVNGSPRCNCVNGFHSEGLSCIEDVELDGGPGGPVTEVPETWTCADSLFDNDSCDCGCGALDVDCTDNTDASCTVNHCDEGTPINDDNTRCFPSLWQCNGEWWGDNQCDCGCGIVDVDCTAATSDVCDYNLCQGAGNTPKPTNNGVCFPSTWLCNGDFYDSGNSVCDCGCGIVDPDCADATAGSCNFCSAPGSCSEGSQCPGAIDSADNASCDCTPVCDVCRTVASDDGCDGTCEANCTTGCNGDTCNGIADIVGLSLTADSTTATSGQDFTVRHQYANQGGTDTVAFNYSFYMHTSAANIGNGQLLQTFSPAILTAGQTRGPFNVNLTIPAGTSTGTYFIGVVYDVNNTVTESSETNNIRTIQINVGGGQADLSVESFTLNTTTVTAGGTVLADYTRRNIGTAASGGFVDGFFISTDAVISPLDTLQQSNSRLSLAPNEQLVATGIAVTIGSGVPPGTYYLGYYVDVNQTISETSELNNYRSVQIVVEGAGLPDLRVQGFSVLTTTPVEPGDGLLVEYSRVNQGDAASGNFHFSVRISDNDVITTLDDEIFGVGSAGLDPGETAGPFSPPLTLDNNMHAGIYWAGAIIDDTFIVTESNEDNNESSPKPFVVVPQTCDKYTQFSFLAAGQSDPRPYLHYEGTDTCTKVDGNSGQCLANDTSATAASAGFYSDSAHSGSFQPIYGGFPSTADAEDWFSMHVDDNSGAFLDVSISLTGDNASGDLDLEVYWVCDSSGPTANGTNGTECSAITSSNTFTSGPGQRCRNFTNTPDETVTFSPDCNGLNDSGTVYVRVVRFGGYAGCAPYTINGHF